MFIVLDWIDWSWKWTQVQLVKKELEKAGKTVKVYDFPRYEEESSFFVKKYLNKWYWEDVSAEVSSYFYALDRYDASFDLKKDLGKYDFVLTNRYVSSSMIHQSAKLDSTKEIIDYVKWLENLEFWTMQIPVPDKVLILDVWYENSLKFIEKKEDRDYIKWWKNKDLHEEKEDFLKKSHDVTLLLPDLLDNFELIRCYWDDLEAFSIPEITKKITDKII